MIWLIHEAELKMNSLGS